MKKPTNVSLVVKLLCHVKFMAMQALTHLGLFTKSHPESSSDDEEWHPATSYEVLVGWPTPSIIPIQAHVLMASIKKKLEVAKYSELPGTRKEEDAECSVCLSCFENNHAIRKLTNCSHVFHRECLDNWVDVGRVTCPLCKSMLYPPGAILDYRLPSSYSPSASHKGIMTRVRMDLRGTIYIIQHLLRLEIVLIHEDKTIGRVTELGD